ncbi:MAG: inositol monophosphatase family protein [Actinomycetota bacterium]|nr:inositol monophosphatase family protein [Actinomycetota bacterium]
MQENEVATRLDAARAYARAGQELILSRISGPARSLSVDTKTSITDMVTDVDRAVEKLLAGSIREDFEHDKIVGEEFGDGGGDGPYAWVVDPIDGTTNFIYGFPAYAISIAVRDLRRDTTVCGVVLDVPRDRLYEAAEGKGAYVDGRRISVTSRSRLAESLIGTGFGYAAEVRRAQGAMVSEILPLIRDIRRAGAASLDLCMVACGELDGYYESGLWPWDFMAGAIIVEEAGGTVTGGLEPTPGAAMTIATNGIIHEQLRELVLSLAAKYGARS